MSSLRQDLHKLLDEISDDSLYEVNQQLQKIRFLEVVEYDDEELTEEDLIRIKIAKQEIARGEYYTFEEVFGGDGTVE